MWQILSQSWIIFRRSRSLWTVVLGGFLPTLFNVAVLALAGIPLEAFPGLGRTLLPSSLPAHPELLLLLSLLLGLTTGPLVLGGGLNSLLHLYRGEPVSLVSYIHLALAAFPRAFLLTVTALALSLALGLLGGIGLVFLFFLATITARLVTGATGALAATLLIFLPSLAYGLWFGETILLVPTVGFTSPDLGPGAVLAKALGFAWRRRWSLLALGLVIAALILAVLLVGGLLTLLPSLGVLIYFFLVQLASLFGQLNLLVYFLGGRVESGTGRLPPGQLHHKSGPTAVR